MIIWGSKGKNHEIGVGQFYCPRCGVSRNYKHMEVGKYFTLYFIPLFKTSTLGEYIECQVCFTPFEKKVLDYDPSFSDRAQKMLSTIQGMIEAGLPIQAIYKELIDNGASKESANTVISMATNGKMKICKSCELIYSDNLKFCPACGNALEQL